MIADAETRAELQDLARRVNSDLAGERAMDVEGQVLEVIRDILASSPGARPAVKDITSWFVDRHGEEYDRKVTTKWIGGVIRRRLHLKTQKSHGVFVIPPEEMPKLARLYEKFGLAAESPQAVKPSEDPEVRVDVGDIGDVGLGGVAM